jgi:hypothetical protein
MTQAHLGPVTDRVRNCRSKALGYHVTFESRTIGRFMKTLNPAVARVLKRLHYPLDVILTCVRWYVAYPLSLRHLEEMMAERGISVDHSTVVLHFILERSAAYHLPPLMRRNRRNSFCLSAEPAQPGRGDG